jgi:MoaA/NifB/PqqE/SkfB family radical SAM enzyme
MVFSGGEPLLREDLPAPAERASRKGLVVVVGTNGTILRESLAQKLVDSGVRGVGISLESLNPPKTRRL